MRAGADRDEWCPRGCGPSPATLSCLGTPDQHRSFWRRSGTRGGGVRGEGGSAAGLGWLLPKRLRSVDGLSLHARLAVEDLGRRVIGPQERPAGG